MWIYLHHDGDTIFGSLLSDVGGHVVAFDDGVKGRQHLLQDSQIGVVCVPGFVVLSIRQLAQYQQQLDSTLLHRRILYWPAQYTWWQTIDAGFDTALKKWSSATYAYSKR